MIAFDNGPADGDYVRYIDELMARAAANASAGTLAPGRETGLSAAALINRLGAPGSVIERALEAVKPASARSDVTVFDKPPERAVAATSSGMSGRIDAGPPISQQMKNTLVALLLGIGVLLVGIFTEPLTPFFIVIGVVLSAWAVRRLVRSAVVARPPPPRG